MILSAQSIRKRRGMVDPFNERQVAFGMSYGLSSAGYDIRIAQQIRIDPGYYSLASSLEHFEIPNDVLANVADKSTWARQGLFVQNTILEPGWKGYLTLELSNSSYHPIIIDAESPIAQIIFHLLDEPSEQVYTGKYQYQQAGVVPAIME